MKFIKFKNWLLERKAETLEYGCIMLTADIPNWKEKLSIIDKKDLYVKDGDYGFEKEPHVTILYGLHDEEIDRDHIYDEIERLRPITVKINNISIFENEEYDVVKFDVPLTKELRAYRKYFKMLFPNTQTFKDYHPHITIAYVKKGEGKKYVQKVKTFETTFNESVYSGPDGKKKKFKL
jgi:hypothetical protein